MRKKTIIVFLCAGAVAVFYWTTPTGSAAPLGAVLVFFGCYSLLSRLRLGRITKQTQNTGRTSDSNLRRFIRR